MSASSPTASNAGSAHSTPPLGTSSAGEKSGATASSSPTLAARRPSISAAPMPIGAARSMPRRSLLLVSSPTALFFRLVQTPRAYRLRQRVGFHAQAIGHLRRLQPVVQQLLGFGQDRWGQDCRAAAVAWCIEPFRSLLPIQFHRALETDFADPESARNLRLFGIAVDAELRGDHAKRLHIRFFVNEHRHAGVEVGDPTVLFAERQQRGDVCHSFGKNGSCVWGIGSRPLAREIRPRAQRPAPENRYLPKIRASTKARSAEPQAVARFLLS